MVLGNSDLHPELRRRGALIRRLKTELTEEDLRALGTAPRWLERGIRAYLPRGLERCEEQIRRADGSFLRILVYRTRSARGLHPEQVERGPGLLWLHGGGYAGGFPEIEAVAFRSFILGSGAVVVAPDYRRSIEAPYPAALDDCYATLLWMRANAESLGVRSDQLAVGGMSAGGGLTAATTLRARDSGDVAVAFQMPIYPMIDDRGVTDSSRGNTAPVWDSVTNQSAWRMYLGDLYGTDRVPAYAAPARASRFDGLPPTFTYVGSVEPFRDETVEYVSNLRAAGVPVDFREFQGAFHGFDGIVPKSSIAIAAKSFREQWFGHAIRTYRAPQSANAVELP